MQTNRAIMFNLMKSGQVINNHQIMENFGYLTSTIGIIICIQFNETGSDGKESSDYGDFWGYKPVPTLNSKENSAFY